jgi:prophage tail gpP-like protein
MPGISMDLIFDGQKMHSDIFVQGQTSVTNPTNAVAASDPLENPYVKRGLDWQGNAKNNVTGNTAIPYKGYRPRVVSQTSGTLSNTDKAQRNALSEELKGISLSIDVHGWTVQGHTLLPGDIVTAVDPELHIYSSARFFVVSAEYRGNEVKETCVLNCVIPEVFNNDTPKNIFA